MKGLRIALPADNKTLRPHAPRDNTSIAGARADITLTGQPDVGSVVVLHLHVVVMAVHSLFRGYEIGKEFAERV